MVKIKLFTMDRSALKQLGMLRRGDRIQIQGCIPPGIRQEEGILVVKVWKFCILLFHLFQPAQSD